MLYVNPTQLKPLEFSWQKSLGWREHKRPTARPADADRVSECQLFLNTVSQTGTNSRLARCGLRSARSQWQKTSIQGDSASFLLLENVKPLIWKASWLPSLRISANPPVALSHLVFASLIINAQKQGERVYIPRWANLFSSKNAKFMKCFYRTVMHTLMLLWSLCDCTYRMYNSHFK